MSCGDPHEMPCEDVLKALILFIDHEIEDINQLHAFEVHFQECAPCHGTMEQERAAVEILQTLLGRSCREEAPEELNYRIFEQTQQLAEHMHDMHQSQFSTQTYIQSEYTRTEITVDGVTQIIETSHEIRRDFPRE